MIQILHILLVQCLWTEERQSLCKSFLSIHCNRPSAHLLSVEDIFLLSWQDAFNQETARAMSFSLLWYHSLYCGVCLVWWFAWQPLIRDVRDVSDRQGPVVPWQGVQVGAGCPLQVLVYQLDITKTCRVNLSTWLEHNGWNSSFCSNTFDTQGDEVLEDIRNKVSSLFSCKSDTGCPNKSSW